MPSGNFPEITCFEALVPLNIGIKILPALKPKIFRVPEANQKYNVLLWGRGYSFHLGDNQNENNLNIIIYHFMIAGATVPEGSK